jgi:glyoxylase-like metal-dependent hydrolase (beta-lactamase superfamily II)
MQDLTEVASGVFVARGTHVCWVLVVDGKDITLVDSGYHGDADRVTASLARVGGAGARLSAVLVTHAHADHFGSVARLRAEYGVPVYAHRDELAHLRGDVVEQIAVSQVVVRAWRPRVLRWTVDILRVGGPKTDRVPDPIGFNGTEPLDVPGGLVPVPLPGHTSGHSGYLVPAQGVLLVGDALTTGHAMSGLTGPHLMPAVFDHDRARALESVRGLATVAAEVVVPSHGPVFRGSPATAVEQALDRAF